MRSYFVLLGAVVGLALGVSAWALLSHDPGEAEGPYRRRENCTAKCAPAPVATTEAP